MSKKKYHPGQNCEKTAKYSAYDEDGNVITKDVDVEKGNRFPPTQEKNCYYKEQ